ncbi:MAG: hypothetical protein RR054_01710 [Clostridia bacterium]
MKIRGATARPQSIKGEEISAKQQVLLLQKSKLEKRLKEKENNDKITLNKNLNNVKTELAQDLKPNIYANSKGAKSKAVAAYTDKNYRKKIVKSTNAVKKINVNNDSKNIENSNKIKTINDINNNAINEINNDTNNAINDIKNDINNVMNNEINNDINNNGIKDNKAIKEQVSETANNVNDIVDASLSKTKEEKFENATIIAPLSDGDGLYPYRLVELDMTVRARYNLIKNYIMQFENIKYLMFKECEIVEHNGKAVLLIDTYMQTIRIFGLQHKNKFDNLKIVENATSLNLPFKSMLSIDTESEIGLAIRFILRCMNDCDITISNKYDSCNYIEKIKKDGVTDALPK